MDTAVVYRNEADVGAAIWASGLVPGGASKQSEQFALRKRPGLTPRLR
jgi:diketogulonate reductase-like aldo/keto reductase